MVYNPNPPFTPSDYGNRTNEVDYAALEQSLEDTRKAIADLGGGSTEAREAATAGENVASLLERQPKNGQLKLVLIEEIGVVMVNNLLSCLKEYRTKCKRITTLLMLIDKVCKGYQKNIWKSQLLKKQKKIRKIRKKV